MDTRRTGKLEVMISKIQWDSLLHFKPSDFKYPDKLQFPVVQGIDRLAARLGVKPWVIDDWRPYSDTNPGSQHPLGTAVDFVVAMDALEALAAIRASRLFSGFGIYVNEVGAQSFHVDTRSDRSVDNPATWGGIITRPATDTGAHVKRIAYVALVKVVDMVKKKSLSVLAVLVLIFLGWNLFKSK